MPAGFGSIVSRTGRVSASAEVPVAACRRLSSLARSSAPPAPCPCAQGSRPDGCADRQRRARDARVSWIAAAWFAALACSVCGDCSPYGESGCHSPVLEAALRVLLSGGPIRPPDRRFTVFFVQQGIEHLAIADAGVDHRIATDLLVFPVDVHVVLAAVVALPILPGPAGILVLLALHVRFVAPAFRCVAFLGLLVLVPCVAVPRDIHQARCEDLAAPRHQPGRVAHQSAGTASRSGHDAPIAHVIATAFWHRILCLATTTSRSVGRTTGRVPGIPRDGRTACIAIARPAS